MTRAVIKLSGDISPLMPLLSKRIAGCAYYPEAPVMAFRRKNTAVTVDPRQINLQKVEDEGAVKDFMAWMASLFEKSI
jgi:hypothetical protein